MQKQTNEQYEAESRAMECNLHVRRPVVNGSLQNEWRYAYLAAVRQGAVILCDIRTRQIVTPWR